MQNTKAPVLSGEYKMYSVYLPLLISNVEGLGHCQSYRFCLQKEVVSFIHFVNTEYVMISTNKHLLHLVLYSEEDLPDTPDNDENLSYCYLTVIESKFRNSKYR